MARGTMQNVAAIQPNPAKRNEGGVSPCSIQLVASRIVDSRIRKCISLAYPDTQKHVQAWRGFMSRLDIVHYAKHR